MDIKIFNLIILDESGSMSSIKQQAINGFNETVQTIVSATIKHPEQTHFVSLVTFNGNGIKTVYDRKEAKTVCELDDKTYSPNCNTPLYDAMGSALTNLVKNVETEDKVLVTIITDGEENASVEYSGKAIKALVEELRAKGWVFAYIGANQDVEKVAATISITNKISFDASSHGARAMYEKLDSCYSIFFDRVADKESDFDLQYNFFAEDKTDD
ncbi:MAG: VWA domain-containing protein [Prevotellaceae bacterium]|jgi:uncharacterized protein YegL|nr:VWA domain-containing protein [Prevotellaceae bacterium]